MSPTLSALIALQQLDTAAEAARKRLGEMPGIEREIDARLAAAKAAVEAAKGRLAENNTARRTREKDVATVDTRLARFEDHKAAVKTNQEFTALLHEIQTAKTEKDAIEEQILLLLEAADGLTAEIKGAEKALTDASREGQTTRDALSAERRALDEELTRLAGERRREAAAVPPPALAKYEQLLKQRRMVAVAHVAGELCSACHVRLRQAVLQQIRRNEDMINCDSCQRILYFVPKTELKETH